jgi:hypothetical protein
MAASRVGTFQSSLALRGYFKAGPSAEMDAVRDEVNTAVLMHAFTDLDDDE